MCGHIGRLHRCTSYARVDCTPTLMRQEPEKVARSELHDPRTEIGSKLNTRSTTSVIFYEPSRAEAELERKSGRLVRYTGK